VFDSGILFDFKKVLIHVMEFISFLSRSKTYSSALITLMLFCSFQPINAQDFERGYIVLNNNDTLYGVVKDRNDGTLFEKIRFKDNRGKVKRYTADDLLAYKVGINTYESLWYAEENEFLKFNYYSRPGYGRKVFLKILAKGHLSCYAKEFMYDDNNFIDQFELFLRDGEKTMARATQGIFGLKKKRLSNYFWDCPILVKKINHDSINTPLNVVSYYNEFCGTQ
jgi:hypothetical protein